MSPVRRARMFSANHANRAIAPSVVFPSTPFLILKLFTILMTACALAPPDGSMSTNMLQVEVIDETGQSWSMDHAPWLPTFVLKTEGGAFVNEVYLFEDVELDAIVRDLERAPFRSSHLERAVALETLEASNNEPTSLRPWQPLPPGEYVFVVPAWAENQIREHFVRPVTVAVEAGSTLLGAWPPDAASGVPVSLSEVHFAFSGPVHGNVELIGHNSSSTLGLVRESCLPFGWDGVCYSARLTDPLRPHERYRYDFSAVRDVAGRRLNEARLDFHTIRQAPQPRVQLDECAIDEVRVESTSGTFAYCVLESDSELRFRVHFDRPFRAHWVSQNDSRQLLAPRGQLEISIDSLRPETQVVAELFVTGLDESTVVYGLHAQSRSALPEVDITEALPNPFGPEPAQEYVEIYNRGDSRVSLDGWFLSDAIDSIGDELAGQLLPGELALLVPADFDADLAGVPLGVQLIRLDASLGTGGLRNRGEPLYLRNGELDRISSLVAPTSIPSEGQCVLRPAGQARFPNVAEVGPCSPGLVE